MFLTVSSYVAGCSRGWVQEQPGAELRVWRQSPPEPLLLTRVLASLISLSLGTKKEVIDQWVSLPRPLSELPQVWFPIWAVDLQGLWSWEQPANWFCPPSRSWRPHEPSLARLLLTVSLWERWRCEDEWHIHALLLNSGKLLVSTVCSSPLASRTRAPEPGRRLDQVTRALALTQPWGRHANRLSKVPRVGTK